MCEGGGSNNKDKEKGGWSRGRGLVLKTLFLIGGALLVKKFTKSTTRWDHARIVSRSLAGEKVPSTNCLIVLPYFYNLIYLYHIY